MHGAEHVLVQSMLFQDPQVSGMGSVEVNPEGPGKSISQFYDRLEFVKCANFSASVCGDHKEHPESAPPAFDECVSKRIFGHGEAVFLPDGHSPDLDPDHRRGHRNAGVSLLAGDHHEILTC